MKRIPRQLTPPIFTLEYLYRRFYSKLVNIATSVFEWHNLPETFDENFLTETLILNGVIGVIQTPNGLKPVLGNVGGEINEFYKPTQFIYANPVLGSGSPTINKNCAVLYLTTFDSNPNQFSKGLSQQIETTALLLADNLLSLNIAQKNTRLIAFLISDNEATANSAEQIVNSMYNGKPFKVISKTLADTIEVNPISQNVNIAQNMRQLIENQQYIIAQFLHELGINEMYNLKRERITSTEIALNADCLDTLIDNIEHQVNKGLDECNKLFGTNIKLTMHRYGEEDNNSDNKEVVKSQLNDDGGDNNNE